MLDIRINQLEKENDKLKWVLLLWIFNGKKLFREIVSLREENRLMRAKLAGLKETDKNWTKSTQQNILLIIPFCVFTKTKIQLFQTY